MNVFFQVIAEKLQPDALGELLVGTILVIYSVVKGVVVMDAVRIALFPVSILAGAVIYTSIKLLFASLAFWIQRSGPFLQLAYEMAEFAKYPTEIYAKALRFVITWIIPFAFVAYLPAGYFLGASILLMALTVFLIVLLIRFFTTEQLGLWLFSLLFPLLLTAFAILMLCRYRALAPIWRRFPRLKR